MDLNLLLVPLIGAFIGWITNLIAIKMLFHPRNPIRILGLTFQGVFPVRQKALAAKIGEVVAEELITHDELRMRMNQAGLAEIVTVRLDQQMDKILWERLPKALPMLAMFLTPELVEKVKGVLRQDINPLVDQVLEEMSDKIPSVFNVREIVQHKVEALSTDRLEQLLLALMKREFKFIELVGAVLGFLIGIIQLGLVYWT
jgi:uncharacterized membrane protein YheB (UPF0754 family)